MPRTVLVTEGDSPLGGALTRLLLARGCSVASTLDRAPAPAAAPSPAAAPAPVPAGAEPREPREPREPTVPTVPTAGDPRRALEVPWNRRSPVSAHSLLLTVLNAFPSLDDVLILEPPCAAERQLLQAESAAIEKAFDDARGPVFLAREILGHFQKNGGGVLCMVSRGPAAGPLENGMRECFRGITSSLFSGAGSGGVVVNGFQQGEAGTDDYAAFIDKTLEEKARKITGRWFSFASRGLFQGVWGARKG